MKVWIFILTTFAILTLGWWGLSAGTKRPTAVGASSSPSAQAGNNPDYDQVDLAGSGKAEAVYLPGESTRTQAVVDITLTSSPGEIAAYDYNSNIIWQDFDENPLTTVSSQLIAREFGKLEVKMTFVRDRHPHHHLLIKELGGVHNRVLHFYLFNP